MPSSVESRVVSLKFDNGQFLNGVRSTLDGMNKLKAGLGGKLGSDGVNELAAAAKKVDLARIGEEARQAGSSISIMAAAGAVALGNLASRAIDAGLALVKRVTIQPLIDGFREYELQLNSIQTILANTASKGETMQTVSAALDELNTYADKTIYNFGQMTSNIGKFTAAGVGLNESVSAIKGLSNLAAMFGVDANSASTAMYQLSQAISSGTIRLQDWISVQNAGMGGEAFQEALKRTARVHGEAVDAAIEKNGSFRESLKEGWLTAEVMLETLSQMTGDLTDEQLAQMGYTEEQIQQIQQMAQAGVEAATYYKTFTQVMGAAFEVVGSGWAQVWRILMGNFEEAQALWTKVGNYITGTIDDMFRGISGVAQRFVDLGGRAAIIEGLGHIFEAIRKPLVAVGQAFNDTFKTDFGHILANIAKAFERLTAMFIMSDDSAAKLRQTFHGLFSVLHILMWPITQIWKLLAFVGEIVLGLTGIIGDKGTNAFLSLTAAIAKGPIAIDEWLQKFDPVGKLVDWLKPKLQAFVEWLGPKFTNAVTTAREALDKMRSAIGERIGKVFSALSDVIEKIATALGDFFAPKIESARIALSEFGKVLHSKAVERLAVMGERAKEAGDIFAAVFSGRMPTITTNFGEKVNVVATALHNAYDWAIEFGKGLLEALDGKGAALLETMSSTIDWISEKLSGLFGDKIKLPDVANSDQVSEAMTSVQTAAEASAANAQSAWEKFGNWWNGAFIPGVQKVWNAVSPVLTQIWEAVKDFAKSFKNAFTFDEGEFGLTRLMNYLITGGVVAIVYNISSLLKNTFGGLSEALDSLKGTLESFNKALEAQATEAKSRAIKNYALALLILAGALLILALIPPARLTSASAAIVTMAMALAIMMKTLDDVGMKAYNMVAMGFMLVAFAAGILLVAAAAAMLATVDPKSITLAMSALILIITSMATAAKAMDDVDVGASTGIALIGLALSIWVIASAVKKLGEMDSGVLMKGVLAVSAIALVMGVYQNLVKNPISIGSAISMLALAFLIQKIASTIAALGEMEWDKAKQGITILVVVIGMIAIAMLASERVDFDSALGLMAGIILLLAIGKVVEQLAAINWANCLKAVITIGIVLAELAIAMTVMNTSITGAAALFLAGAALMMIGGVVAKLSGLSWKQLAVGLVGLAGALAIVIAAGYLGQGAALGLLVLAAAIGALGLVIAGIGAVLTAVTAFLTIAAVFGAPAFIALAKGIEVLAATIPTVIASVFDGILLLSQLIWDNKETLAQGMAGLIIALAEAVTIAAPSVFDALSVLLQELLDLIVEKAPDIAEASYKLLIAMADKIIEYMPTMTEKGKDLIIAFLKGINGHMTEVTMAAFETILTFINGLAVAIRANTIPLNNALMNLLNAIGYFFRYNAYKFKEWGKDIVRGISSGIANNAYLVAPSITTVALKLGSTFKSKLGIKSPSRVFMEYGKFVVMGAAIGIARNAALAEEASSDAADGIIGGFNKAIKDGIFSELDDNPLTITPVLDLSMVNAGLSTLGSQGISLQARNASTLATKPEQEATPPAENQIARAQVVYNQTINSPDPLSEAEIYRRTRNLVARTANR